MTRTLTGTALLLVALGAASTARAESTSLAITYFTNNTGDAAFDPLGRGLADMLITDLSHVETIQVVERQRLNEVLSEIELGASKFIDPKTAAKMGKGLGARYIVTGAFISIDPALRIDGRVVEVSTSKVVFSTKVEGKKNELFLLEKELATALLQGIGVKASPRQAAKMGRVATESFDAFKEWSSGLAALDRGDIEAAKRALEAALAADERFDAAKKLLAGIRSDIGRITERRREVEEKNVGRLLERIDAIAEAKGPYDELGPALMTLFGNLPAGARNLKRAATKVIELKLPESVRTQIGASGEPLNALALASYVNASVQLRAHSDVVSYGREFMKRYPSSIYFQSTRMSVNSSLSELEKREKGRREVKRLMAEADMERAEQLCRRHLRPKLKVAACRKFLERAKGTEEEDDAVRSLTSAMRDVRSKAELEAIVEELGATKDGAVARERAEREVKSFERKLERAAKEIHEPLEATCFDDLDAARAERACKALLASDADDRIKKRAEREMKSTRSEPRDPERAKKRFDTRLERAYRNAAKALFEVGRDAEAIALLDEGLGRLPKAEDLHELSLDWAMHAGDVKRAERALARWKASGLKVDARTDKQVRDLASRLVEAKDVEPLVLQGLAGALARVGQADKAAATYLEIAKKHPDTEFVPHRRAWMLAGTELANAGAIDDARAAYQRVLESWPGTQEAETARTLLTILPD